MSSADVTWRSPAAEYVPELDGLRTLAIIAVFGIHLSVLGGGFIGVGVFFCISGYLIGSLLLGEKSATGSVGLRSFYLRRMARLYPALIVAMLVVAAPVYVLRAPGDSLPVLFAAVLSLTYSANLFSSVSGIWLFAMNPTWTLAQEEQFYLLAPWLIRRGRRPRFRRTARLLAMAAVCVVSGRFVASLLIPQAYRFIYENPILNLDGMLLGLALAFAAAGAGVPGWLRGFAKSRVGAVLALLAVLLVTVFSTDIGWRWSAGLTVASAATVVLIIHVSTADSILSKVLRSLPARWIGQRSYGLYLFHYPLVLLVRANEPTPPLEHAARAVLAVTLTLVLAVASERWLETPVRRWVRSRPAIKSRVTAPIAIR